MKKLLVFGICCLLLAGCAAQTPPPDVDMETLPQVTEFHITPTEPTEPAETPAPTEAETPDLFPEDGVEIVRTGYAPTLDPQESSGNVPAAPLGPEDFVAYLNGVAITPGDDYNTKLEAVGGDPVIQKGQACIGGGYDTNYYYDNETFTVYTVVDGSAQLVYDIYVTGPGYPSSRGAEVGVTTREGLHRLYGEPSSVMAGTDRYTMEGSTAVLSFTFRSGVLISYDINNAALAD